MKEIEKIISDKYGYVDNPNNDICIREHNQRMFDKRAAFLDGVLYLQKRLDSKIVVYKDGSYKFVGASFEYEGDPEWLTTINLLEEADKKNNELQWEVLKLSKLDEPINKIMDRDEFAIGFHRYWSSRVSVGDQRTLEDFLSEYKSSLNQEKKRSPVIGTGIPEGGKDYE